MNFELGDTVNFDVDFKYMGPAYNAAKLRCSVGLDRPLIGFDEVAWGEKTLILPSTPAWEDFHENISYVLKSPLVVADGYEIETKIYEGLTIHLFDHKDNVIDIIEADRAFDNLTVVISKG